MGNRTLRKNLFREVRSTAGRFFAIFAITALGAGFYAGLRTTGPNMLITADQYYAEQNLMDFRLLSTMGFTEEDVEALLARPEIDRAMAGQGLDVLLEVPGGTQAVRLRSLPEDTSENNPNYLNRLVVTQGRLPQTAQECIADSAGGQAIGDMVRIADSNNTDTLDLMAQREFKVVGLAQSPAYISFGRGNTNIGDGRIASFFYLRADAFDSEFYTEIFLRAKGADGLSAFSDEYTDLISAGVDSLEQFGKERSEIRLEEIRTEAEQELADARIELADARREADTEFADAWQTILDGEAEIADGQREINENAQKLVDARQKLADGTIELQQGRTTLEENAAKLDAGDAEYQKQEKIYAAGLATWAEKNSAYYTGLAAFKKSEREFNAGFKEYEKKKAEFEKGLAEYTARRAEYDAAVAQLASLSAAVDSLEASNATLAGLLAQIGAGSTPEELAAEAAFVQGVGQSAGALRQMAAGMQTGGMVEAGAGLTAAADAVDAALATGQYSVAYGVLAAVPGQVRPAIAAADAQLAAALPALEAAKKTLDDAKPALDAATATMNAGRAELDKGRAELAAGRVELDKAKAELDAGRAELDKAGATIAAGRAALDAGWAKLTAGEKELADARATIEDGERQLAEARITLADAKVELADGKQEYFDEKADAEQKLADAEQEIADGQQELDELETPKWLVYDRDGNPGYAGFSSDADRIDAVAQVFPLFFFLVAALVCLTTMTRMVEDQRTQIGTFKALGYSNSTIASKYLLYASAASISGSLFGVAVCSVIFPVAIWQAYSMLYLMPSIYTGWHTTHALVSVLGSVLSTTIATLAACINELRSVPASLMRPKAPRPGKKVLLERIPWLWKHMNFSQKVTAHNIFRYKRRLFMTVIGVAGCTALLLTGFGLKDSITGIVGLQFGDLYRYNIVAALEDASDSKADSVLNTQFGASNGLLYVQQTAVDAVAGSYKNTGITTNLYVMDNPARMQDFISLRNRESGKPIPFPPENGNAVITEKLATRMHLAPGDTFSINRVDDTPVELQVAAITENYTLNYIYITPETYQNLFGEAPEFKTALLLLPEDISAEDSAALLAKLVDTDNVVGAVNLSSMRAEFDDMFESLGAVIWVVIISAGLLAFVVLYNLTNINITERQREIATLKVLGFYDKEVAGYVFRENLILTAIGAAVGLVLGIFLHQFVMQKAEIDEVMFRRVISVISYVWAVLFTMASAMLVNLVMSRRLRKVDMVESLKSAE